MRKFTPFLALLATVGVVVLLPAGPSRHHPGTAAVVRHVEVDRVLAAGSAGLYAFEAYVGGKAVRWNPCAALHWRFNPRHAPAGALTALDKSIFSVATITGTHWIYDGTTSEAPTYASLPLLPSQHRPIVLGWDAPTNPLLSGDGPRTAGVAASTWFSYVHSATQTVGIREGGVVAFNDAAHLPIAGNGSWTEVALHELAHIMGSAHVANPAELMNPVLSPHLASLQPGDREGLHYLGRQQGCLEVR